MKLQRSTVEYLKLTIKNCILRDTSKKPELFSSKSLVIMTKFVAIYATFHIVTVLAKTYFDAQATEPTVLDEYQIPIFVVAGLHLLMLFICVIMILTKKYYWIATIACIALSLYTRFFFEDIVAFINS